MEQPLFKRRLKRVFAGGQDRISRLHDGKGNLIMLHRFLLHGTLNLFYILSLRLFGYRPTVPLIPYAAICALDKILTPQSIVLEFGSGMSTVWLAKRCRHLYSVEHSETWFQIVSERLQKQKLNNITYALIPEQAEYVRFPENVGALFDLIVLDGWFRTGCLEHIARRLKPGGYIFVDDTDWDMKYPNGPMRRIEKYIDALLAQKGGHKTYYTDFSPTQAFVKQGLIAQVQ